MIIRIVVDFPAPLGPRKPVTTPECLDTARASIMGVLVLSGMAWAEPRTGSGGGATA
jgi:hypothetical protein